MKVVKKILVGLLVVLVAIQLFHPAQNKAAGQTPNNILLMYPAGAVVTPILEKACYDCHSNNTTYPWYANIQPVAWWLNGHIKEGKQHLNFSEFGSYPLAKQYHKLEEAIELVKEEEMPLYSYTLVHRDADLSKEQRVAFVNWASSIRTTMEATYPKDSLIRKSAKAH